ncbi:unnamed protein product [Camellia sinensis]
MCFSLYLSLLFSAIEANGFVYCIFKFQIEVNMIKSEQETKNLKLKRDLIFLILQFLNEEKYTESLHKLEWESGCFFNMNYFEELIIDGNWDEMERYLSGFTKLDDNYSRKIFFELRKYKYLEALDRRDHVAATTIFVNELKVFLAFNQDVFNDLTKLLTLDDFRENKQLASYINATDARSKMLVWFRDLMKANVVFHDRLNFPNLADSRLRNLINQSHPNPSYLIKALTTCGCIVNQL